MKYPLTLKFKHLSLSEQFSASDADGQPVLHIKQKMFKLKEDIQIFRDNTQQELLYTLKADRVFDFSPQFNLALPDGTAVGSIKRNGRRSLWKANYILTVGDLQVGTVSETNPWAKVLNGLLGAVPFVGPILDMVSGYVLNPAYALIDPAGNQLALLRKEPAFLEGKFSLSGERLANEPDSRQQELVALLAAVVLMERSSG